MQHPSFFDQTFHFHIPHQNHRRKYPESIKSQDIYRTIFFLLFILKKALTPIEDTLYNNHRKAITLIIDELRDDPAAAHRILSYHHSIAY